MKSIYKQFIIILCLTISVQPALAVSPGVGSARPLSKILADIRSIGADKNLDGDSEKLGSLIEELSSVLQNEDPSAFYNEMRRRGYTTFQIESIENRAAEILQIQNDLSLSQDEKQARLTSTFQDYAKSFYPATGSLGSICWQDPAAYYGGPLVGFISAVAFVEMFKTPTTGKILLGGVVGMSVAFGFVYWMAGLANRSPSCK